MKKWLKIVIREEKLLNVVIREKNLLEVVIRVTFFLIDVKDFLRTLGFLLYHDCFFTNLWHMIEFDPLYKIVLGTLVAFPNGKPRKKLFLFQISFSHIFCWSVVIRVSIFA